MSDLLKRYGPWALITGASSGIGKAFAHALAAEGFNLVIVSRRADALDTLKLTLEATFHVQISVAALDLTDSGAIQVLDRQTSSVDIGLMVLSAGVDHMGLFANKNYADLESMLKLNIAVPTEITHLFGKKMAHRKRSGIILISSVLAFQGTPHFATYAATKSYLLTLGEALNVELRPKGIDVLTLLPGLTDTPMTRSMGIDWSKMPVCRQSSSTIARIGLRHIGRKSIVVTGFLNSIYAWQTRFLPRAWVVKLYDLLFSRAINSFQRFL